MRFVSTVCLLAVIVLAAPSSDAAISAPMGRCLKQAMRGPNPAVRDQARSQCLKTFRRKIDIPLCLKLAHGFEYSTNAEVMKADCLFEQKRDPKASECIQAARSMEYGQNRDDLIWGCLARIGPKISRKNCRELIGNIVFPHLKIRASSYCENEAGSEIRALK